VSTICTAIKMNKVGVKIANQYMDKIGENIGPSNIIEMMDYNSITLLHCTCVHYVKLCIYCRTRGIFFGV